MWLHVFQVSCPAQAGHPVFQRPVGSSTAVSGILDRLVKPGDDIGYRAMTASEWAMAAGYEATTSRWLFETLNHVTSSVAQRASGGFFRPYPASRPFRISASTMSAARTLGGRLPVDMIASSPAKASSCFRR